MQSVFLRCSSRPLPALWGLLAVAGALLPAGCDTRPARQPATPAPVAPVARPAAPPALVAAAPAPPATAPPVDSDTPLPKLPADPNRPAYRVLRESSTFYHRYVGWLGTRPVVVELFTGQDIEDDRGEHMLTGRYYDARRGTATSFSAVDFHPHRGLRLATYYQDGYTQRWHMQQPLGPRLTGTVTVAGQPRRHFILRESYHAAVPLVIRTAKMYRPPRLMRREPGTAPDTLVTYYRWRYVQLLGQAAHHPALRRLLPSRPAQVRARLRAMLEENELQASTNEYTMRVELNDYGILSYSKAVSYDYFGANHPDNLFQSFSCDLYTGRRITLAGLLRPGSRLALHRLALRYMDAGYRQEIADWHGSPEAPGDLLTGIDLAGSFGLTPEGLLLDADIGPHVMGSTSIVIPYAALRPLLRPRTPLNRVLVARGLRPVL